MLNPVGGEMAGVGHYIYHLVANLLDIDSENEYVLFVDERFRATEALNRKNCRVVCLPWGGLRRFLPVVYPHHLVAGFIGKQKLDLYHGPANVIPLGYDGPSVLTVHDLAIYEYPEFFPGGFFGRQTFSTRVVVPKSLAKARRIIAVSKSTKSDIIERFEVAEDRVDVIYEGVDHAAAAAVHGDDFPKLAAKYGIGDRYFLYVGTIEPRKNLVRLVRAFRNLVLALDSPAKGWQLVLAGGGGWHNDEIYRAIGAANASMLGRENRRSGRERRSGVDSRSEELRREQGERRSGIERRRFEGQPIKHLGYVGNDEKYLLMSKARAFVFPSLYEGFGLPVAEAMSVGAPLVVSDAGSLRELADDDCGIVVKPDDEPGLAAALERMIVDEEFNSSCRRAALERSKDFSWRECARETLETYREALDGQLDK